LELLLWPVAATEPLGVAALGVDTEQETWSNLKSCKSRPWLASHWIERYKSQYIQIERKLDIWTPKVVLPMFGILNKHQLRKMDL